MKKSIVFLSLLSTALSSCAAHNANIQAKRSEFNRTIPICTEGIDCKAKWEAAQIWISKNSGYKLQIATDVILETYNPTGSSTRLGVKVLKEPLGKGNYKIVVSTYCDNIFGCTPDSWDAALDFNRYVNAASY